MVVFENMKRNIQLDFLRFCGVFLVMVTHTYITGNTILDKGLSIIKVGGWTGVDLFFVLSGYLVSGLIIREQELYGSFNAVRFLIRRGFKIYPTYYLFIIFSFILGLYSHSIGKPPTLTGLFHEAIFVANYFSNNNGILWSISVEEHFYFILAIVFLILIRFKKIELRSFIFIYAFLLVEGIGFRLYNYFHYSDFNFVRDYTKSHFRFDSLFFGVLLAYLVNSKSKIIAWILSYKYRILFSVMAIGFLMTNFILTRRNYPLLPVINLAVNPVCYGYLMLVVIDIKNIKFVKIISPLAYIGKYSYSIYLFHFVFDNIAMRLINHGGVFYYLLYFSSAITGGIIISKCIEYPLIGFRERYFPSRSKEPAVILTAVT